MKDTDRKLHNRMRAHVGDIPGPRAAVELLIAHGRWLRRTDFLDQVAFTGTDFDTDLTSTGIEWTLAVNALEQGLACSPADESLLRIAASLARGIPLDLRRAMAGLDDSSTAHVMEALGRVAGRSV